MKLNVRTWAVAVVVAAASVTAAPSFAVEVDVEAALALARRESCLKCHSVERKKDGPAYRQVAAKYRDKPDAEEKLMTHLTSGRIVKLSSGDEEEHRNIKGRDEGEIRNLIRWILSQ